MNVCDEEIRYILKFYYINGKNDADAVNTICAVYRPNVVAIREAQMWFKRFKSGNFSMEDEVCSGRLTQIKSVPSLRKWSKIDILVGTKLLKNWILIIKQFYVIYESLGTGNNLTFVYHMISLREI